MKRFKIKVYRRHPEVTIYTVQFHGVANSETEAFIDRILKSSTHINDLQTITYYLDKISKEGVLKRYFRSEGRALAIPVDHCNLRLYCVRLSDKILILGNGGVKSSKTAQSSPDCYPYFQDMNNIAGLLRWSIGEGLTKIDGKYLKGRLKFTINDKS